MKRPIQGLLLGAGLIAVSVLLIAFALAWGPQQHVCKIAFPMVIGCAIGTYEGLASGVIAASSALFAGWLVWSAVRAHISADSELAAAERTEAARLLRKEIDDLAGGLGAVWRILDSINKCSNANETRSKLKSAIFGIDQITQPVRLARLRRVKGFLAFACGRVQVMCPACLRGVMTAGPDVIRRSGPYQTLALDCA